MAYGTLSLADLQATQNNTIVARYGLVETWKSIQVYLDEHNTIVQGLYADFVERSTDRLRRYGGVDTLTMEDGDETTMPHPQKVTAGSNVAFPLNSAVIGMQFTEMWYKKHTIGELQAQVDAIMAADVARIERDIKRALFFSSNYTQIDRFTDSISLDVKRLVNADSAALPPGPNGEAFTASSHTHYIARVSTLAASDISALITTVKEHFSTGEVLVYINQAQEAAVRGFTSNFTAYPDPRLAFSVDTTRTTGRTLDPIDLYNRAIGIFDGAEVLVKPWVPANYMFCFNKAMPKSLVYRYDVDYGDGLQLVYDNPMYPTLARGYRRISGLGSWNRINGAVLYVGGTSYVNPTLT